MNKKEIQILKEILSGKSLTEVIIRFNTDSDKVDEIVAKYEILKANRPPKKYALDEQCNILLDGRPITSCRELHNGDPTNQPWLQIEKKCLRCLVQQNTDGEQSPILQLVKDVQPYFHRPETAILQMLYKLR